MEEGVENISDESFCPVAFDDMAATRTFESAEITSQNILAATVAGQAIVQYTGAIAQNITNTLLESRQRIAELNHELAVMEQTSINAAQTYQMVKPTIDKTHDEIETILKMMKKIDQNKLNDKAWKAFQMQMAMVAGLRRQIMTLYEIVLG